MTLLNLFYAFLTFITCIIILPIGKKGHAFLVLIVYLVSNSIAKLTRSEAKFYEILVEVNYIVAILLYTSIIFIAIKRKMEETEIYEIHDNSGETR